MSKPVNFLAVAAVGLLLTGGSLGTAFARTAPATTLQHAHGVKAPAAAAHHAARSHVSLRHLRTSHRHSAKHLASATGAVPKKRDAGLTKGLQHHAKRGTLGRAVAAR